MTDRSDERFELNDLLHPASAFEHPSEVVSDPDFTLNEKRAILASWASDACTLEAGTQSTRRPKRLPVRFDDIMDALRTLDKQVNGDKYRRLLRRKRIFRRTARPVTWVVEQ